MWSMVYLGFDPQTEGTREALCTLGNGYFATRGAVELADADGVHYPATYLAGGYNRLVTDVAGRPVENEDLVNLPNWLCLHLRVGEDPWFDLSRLQVLFYRQELRFREGLLTRTLRVRDDEGRTTHLEIRRFVHMGKPHLAAIEMRVRALDWSGPLHVRSALDGRVVNAGVARYRSLASSHLLPRGAGLADGGIHLTVETSQSRLRVAEAARTSLHRDDEPLDVIPQVTLEDDYAAQEYQLDLHQGETVRVEKLVALYTSRDRAISEPTLDASIAVGGARTFGEELAVHTEVWRQLWRRCDIVLSGDGDHPELDYAQRILRLHIFHVLQTMSRHSVDLDVGVPARGWTGEAYRGHVFWDELFVVPFLTFRLPEIARSLLLYRFRRLNKARDLARDEGYRGAMYPWQSGSDGREETQIVHLNPVSGRWLPDASHLQRHVNAAIAFNVWQYFRITDDYEFLHVFGAEMLAELARFWASLATHDPGEDRWEIHGVMGPDEYHEGYPDADQPGLNNNAYTNIMAAWTCWAAGETLAELLPERRAELRRLLSLRDEEVDRWAHLARRMKVPFHGDRVISQFEGYEGLKEFDWEGYRARYGDIHRLDRILEAEGDNTDNYKLSKQADVLMLPYLFSDRELQRIFARLGYEYDVDATRRNFEYYLARTSHGSTLSFLVHAAVAARFDPALSRQLYTAALTSDVRDVQGGTTKEGIHLGAMAGSVDLIQRSFTGLEISEDGALHIDPPLPERPGRLEFALRFHRSWIDLTLAGDGLRVCVRRGGARSVYVRAGGQGRTLAPGDCHHFVL